jgi:hypothetical protein
MRLSPDGRYVAVVVTRESQRTPQPRGTLEVIDTRTGQVEVVQNNLAAWSNLTWTDDSKRLFSASSGPSGMTIGEFSIRSAHAETEHLSAQDVEQFVIVQRSDAKALLSGATSGPSTACPSMSVTYPSRVCAYSY